MKIVSTKTLVGFTVLLLTASAFAVSTNTLTSHIAQIRTDYIDALISLDYPGFEGLSVDSLGKEHFPLVAMKPPAQPWRPTLATRRGSCVEYRCPGRADSSLPRWAIEIETNEIQLKSQWSAEDPPEPLVLDADTSVSHVTLLGLVETNGSIRLPAIMHFPEQGSFQISASFDQADPLGYVTTRKNTKIIFSAATQEHPSLTYRLKVVCIYPSNPGIGADPRFDGFHRDWLNIFQINPQRRVLANNAGSDSCGFCYYEYADIATNTPPLAEGLTAMDMVRQTLDRIIGGFEACGMPGYTLHNYGHEDRPACSADTFPSFLIAAEDYAQGSHDDGWLTTNYNQIKSWADQMLATDGNGDGLVKYILSGNSGSWPEKTIYRPANWWDTIGFGYEDAYANALAYRALLGMEKLAQQANHIADSASYRAAADKLKAAYFKTFYDPATGVLAGWRSADGQLHDYYFLFVNGIAIHYNLVPKDKANSIMDNLLAKMKAVGYTNFALGLPGNLIPVASNDYVGHYPGFQIYENGGATACFAYYTLAALYDLGRIQDGDRILFQMLDSFAKGDFQGFGANKKSKDWKTWSGECHGYEGLLNDNYYALLAVLDRETALKRQANHSRDVSILFKDSDEPTSPVGLLVNGAVNPLAIDRDMIRFTWRLTDTTRGEIQTTYQILVASNAESLAAGKADCWDSGKVDSDKSASVEYAGKPLPPATRFWWKVRIWDQAGKPSSYSSPNYFDTGLNQGEWKAHYIWNGTTNLNNFAYFRKAFIVTNQPVLAKVYVTAHNDYLLYCNGQLLGRGPARCDPYHYGQYNAYDITGLMKPGTNVFAAIGHWVGTWNNAGVNARPAFLLEARLDYPDGSSTTIGTDESWRVLAHTPFIETNATYFPVMRTHPVPAGAYRWTIPEETAHSSPEYVEINTGETGGSRAAIQFDSRLEPVGWKSVDFDDSNWATATVVDRSLYHLFAQMAPMEREQAELEPVSIISTNGAWLVNFGRCIDGWPKITMRDNRSGEKVRVEYFQMTGERKSAGWDEYTCHGGTETWDADFGRHASFQVLKITGYAGKLRTSDVRGMWAYCDADVAGRFHCSSDLLNSIYEMCERSARQNIQQAIISVDANREQSSWMADSWNIANVLLYNDRDTMMIDKVVRDYAAAQLTNGDFPACSPAQRSRRIPEWSMYWPMLLWQQYLFSGDETLLREMAPRLTHFLDWIKPYQNPTNNLLNPPGWRISEYAGGNLTNGGYNIATACQYYENLRIASYVFSALGETNQSNDYLRQAEEVKAGINSNLFNGEFYLARTDRKEMFPLASAWALRFDIESMAEKSRILDAIEKAGKPNIGGYGGDAFYSGLLNAGGGDLVVRDLARYRPMLEDNKANWESFGGAEANHAWTSYPAYIFLKYICGIQPTSGGFATFDVRPETGGLTFAEGTVPTVKGLITTRWEKSANGRFNLSITVPANARAAVYLPKLSMGNFTITESGKVLWPANSEVKDSGVLAVSEEYASIKCLVGAGDYRFNDSGSP